jgi:O-antigen ligase
MRKTAWVLLLLFAFAIPWEYSLDLGEPLGNIARIVGVVLLPVALLSVLMAGKFRTPGPVQWLTLAFYLFFFCSYFWTIEPLATIEKMRGYFQETMIVWLLWEFTDSPDDLRNLLHAFVAGSWVLAILTLANFRSVDVITADQIRFVAEGQDPNDVARFLDVCFPLAALLLNSQRGWLDRLLALGYFPLGVFAVVLTASRGGFLVALLALAGSGLLLIRSYPRGVIVGSIALPALAIAFWLSIPAETLQRLSTIPDQLQGGDLNQRLNIWDAGWHAFLDAPWIGTGAGSFTAASAMHPFDTAHNTVLSILVGGGLCALALAMGIGSFALRSTFRTSGSIRIALLTALTVWGIASLVDTVEENRMTWFLLGFAALAGRLADEDSDRLVQCFSGTNAEAHGLALTTEPWGWIAGPQI